MKFVLKIVATICLGALFHATPTVAYSTGLTALYGLVCADYAQMSNDPTGATTSSLLYTDNSPFQFVTGFALGEQVQAGATISTCFGQSYQTKVFLDDIADQCYTIGLQLY